MALSDVMASLFLGRGHKYTALPVSRADVADDSTANGSDRAGETTYPVDVQRAVLRFIMGATSALLVGYLVFSAFCKMTRSACVPRPCDTPDQGYTCNANITHRWGQYSPFFSVPSEIDAAIPAGCTVTFAQTVVRHGARDPTASKTKTYAELVARIQASVAASAYGAGFEFLRTYNYTLGADELTPFGQQEMANAGTRFYRRYRALAASPAVSLPFVRAAGSSRVVESADFWTRGYHAARFADNGSDTLPYPVLAIGEDDGVNNTLSHGLCPAFEDGAYSAVGDAAAAAWLAVFGPALAARLGAGLPGANVSAREAVYMMDICALDTAASEGGKTLSPFCALFGDADWRDYDYYQSVGKWYGFGPGNALGAAQGVGWVAELVARLTDAPVVAVGSVNASLDADGATFPLGRRLYADFTHDNDLMGYYAALGLYNGSAPLSLEAREDESRTDGYAARWTVTFAARMYVEKMVCAGLGEEELVRVLVNDRVIPLQNCGADELGRCKLGSFVDSLAFARSGANWDQCYI